MLNNMKVLIGLLIVVAGLAYWVSQKDKHVELSEQPLMPDWQSAPALLSEIDQVIMSKGNEVIKLTKKDTHWILNDGFYASIDPLFSLLQSTKNAVVVELKTANPDNHARLELADSDLLVEFNSKNNSMGALHIGKKTSAGYTFVRRGGENQSYAVKNFDQVSFNIDGWKLKTVLDISVEEIKSVSMAPKDAPGVSIKRVNDSGEWELVNLPLGQQLKENAYLNQLANALSRLMIDDALTKALDGMDELLVGNYQLKNGNEIVITVYQKEEAYYLTIDSNAHSHYADWMMKIPEYKFKSLNRSMNEFIEPADADNDETVPNEVEASS